MVTTRTATRAASSVTATRQTSELDDPPQPAKRLKTAATTEKHATKAAVAEHAPSRQPKINAREKEEPQPADYRPRISNPWKVGAHVSVVGGVENAIQNAAELGANSFALFLKSQRRWTSPPLKDDSVSTFKARLKTFGYSPSHILPHGSYLINLGNPDQQKRSKSYECFLDDLQRCEQLGLVLYNFHPGSTVGLIARDASITLIAECLNRAHKATSSVITVIENMAGAGNIIGSAFADLGDIIRQVEDKTRVGVCIDTCHMFAAGYDIRTKEGWEAAVSDLDKQVGLSYLRGIHLNDSKTPLGSKRDRHENIGMGHIGLLAFRHIVSDSRLQNIPLVLETPSFDSTEVWTQEIALLNQLSTMRDTDPRVIAELKTGIEEVVKRVRGISNPSAKIGGNNQNSSKSKAVRKRGGKRDG